MLTLCANSYAKQCYNQSEKIKSNSNGSNFSFIHQPDAQLECARVSTIHSLAAKF